MNDLEEKIRSLVHNWCDEQVNEIPDQNRHALMDEIKELVMINKSIEGFEEIWIEENVNRNYLIRRNLKDDDYIRYHIWENQNNVEMVKKHLPDSILIKGRTSYIVFHGGCLGCTSQRIHGISKCKGCKYFKGNSSLPNLYVD